MKFDRFFSHQKLYSNDFLNMNKSEIYFFSGNKSEAYSLL